MAETNAEIEALRAELAEAFGERTRPVQVVYPHPGGCGGEDHEGLRQWLRDRPWQEVLEDEVLLEYRDYVHFLTPEGWAYYFPALGILALDLDSYAELDDSLMTRLAWFPQEIDSLLNPNERWAVVHWLEYLSAQYDERGWCNLAQYALDFHWFPKPPEMLIAESSGVYVERDES